MEHKNAGTYASLIQAQNCFLKSVHTIPLFKLHRKALKTLVNPMDDTEAIDTLRTVILLCSGIMGIEGKFATDRLGKWFIIASRQIKSKAIHFSNETLPAAFRNRQVLDLDTFYF